MYSDLLIMEKLTAKTATSSFSEVTKSQET